MVLAPAILWTIVVAAGMVFLGVATHLWILSVLAAVIVIATIVAFVQAWQERERRRAFRRTHTWLRFTAKRSIRSRAPISTARSAVYLPGTFLQRRTVAVYAFDGRAASLLL
jgi:hypothetical protein